MAYRATARTEAHRVSTRQNILSAARGLVLAGGFTEVSMAAVAVRAGVATGTIYRHFSSKEALCAELFCAASKAEVDRVRRSVEGPGNASQRLADTARLFARRAIRGRHLAYALIAEPLDPALEQQRLDFRRAYATVFRSLLEEGVANKEFAPLDPHIAATALVGLLAESLVGPLAPSSHALSGSGQQHLIEEISNFCLRAVACNRMEKNE